MRAIWNGETLAESDETVVVEGNHCFPPETVNADLLVPTRTRTLCPWKGMAHYYTNRDRFRREPRRRVGVPTAVPVDPQDPRERRVLERRRDPGRSPAGCARVRRIGWSTVRDARRPVRRRASGDRHVARPGSCKSDVR
jgi:hypothetical protein